MTGTTFYPERGGRRWRRIVSVVAAVLAVVALGGCLPPAPAPTQPPGPPVLAGDFPDPHLVNIGGSWYGFATGGRVPTITGPDLAHLKRGRDALPKPAAWSNGQDLWAPSMLPGDATRPNLLYYSVQRASDGARCLSVASSPTAKPLGPYVDSTTGPLLCMTEFGGAIDPSPTIDVDGTIYLAFKTEGIVNMMPTHLWTVELTPDGRSLAFSPYEMLFTADPWEGHVIENPALYPAGDGRWWLFYSANYWDSPDYGIGVAECDSIQGPCERVWSTPILASRDGQRGPGGAMPILNDAGRLAIAYHAWPGAIGYDRGGQRQLFVTEVTGDPPHIL